MRQPPLALLVIALTGAAWQPKILIGMVAAGIAFLILALLVQLHHTRT
jgi:hypothetical protein